PVSNEGKEIKITDKRMFTADGELREEYRFLNEKSTAEPPAPAGAASPSGIGEIGAAGAAGKAAAPPRPGAAPAPLADLANLTDLADLEDRSASSDPQEPSARLELPGTPPGLGPSFYD